MVMATTHSEPKIAVRTPARNGSLDCELLMKLVVSQLRKYTSEPGNLSSASENTLPRAKMESNSPQVA